MYKIIISGLGGQGIVTLSKLIANAFINRKYHCLIKFSYGKSINNSDVLSNIIVSENKIYSPYIDFADHIILLSNNENIYKYANNKTLFYLNNFDISKEFKSIKIDPINILENFNNKLFINTYILGVFVKKTNLLSDDNVKKALKIVFEEKDFSIMNKNYKVYLEGKNNCVLSV